METRTHRAIDPRLSGHVVELRDGVAELELVLGEAMRADAHGLVHGGFVFSLADHAAMLAINHPNVVLGSARVQFLQPATVGERVRATAKLAREEGRKQIVEVEVRGDRGPIFEGEFTCFSPSRHVLERPGAAD